ncbi:MAG: hypothetical protein PVH60_09280 [Anaerolineales bacterium]|jgi:hypothetical protein
MLKKLIVGVLSLSVLGAGGAAVVHQTTRNDVTQVPSESVLAGQDAPTDQTFTANDPLGEPWSQGGKIVAIDEFGLTLRNRAGEEHYVELGPPDYWQNQGIQLRIGQEVTVEGSINEGMIHAYRVQFQDGELLNLRTESGQPMWSGGIGNGQGQANSSADGSHLPEPQAQVEEWITVQGELIAFQNGNMTISTTEGDLLSFKTGQPRFLAEQGISFQVGDEVSVVGFFAETGEFMAGEITQTETASRAMLRDPNGRPLWAGPGNGRGNGNGQAQ